MGRLFSVAANRHETVLAGALWRRYRHRDASWPCTRARLFVVTCTVAPLLVPTTSPPTAAPIPRMPGRWHAWAFATSCPCWSGPTCASTTRVRCTYSSTARAFLFRRLRADLILNTDREYRLGSYEILSKYVALGGKCDRYYGLGADLRFIY